MSLPLTPPAEEAPTHSVPRGPLGLSAPRSPGWVLPCPPTPGSVLPPPVPALVPSHHRQHRSSLACCLINS